MRDDHLAESLAISGKPAQSMLLIKVNRVLCHCPKAFVRGGVWSPEKWPDTSNVPPLAIKVKQETELNLHAKMEL